MLNESKFIVLCTCVLFRYREFQEFNFLDGQDGQKVINFVCMKCEVHILYHQIPDAKLRRSFSCGLQREICTHTQ